MDEILELPSARRRAARAAAGAPTCPDPDELDLGSGEVRALLDRFRALPVPEPRSRVSSRIREQVRLAVASRRSLLALRAPLSTRLRARLRSLSSSEMLVAAGIFAVLFFGWSRYLDGLGHKVVMQLPSHSLGFDLPAALAPVAADVEPGTASLLDFRLGVEQMNLVRRTREEFFRRYLPEERALALRNAGGDAKTESKVSWLSAEVAEAILAATGSEVASGLAGSGLPLAGAGLPLAGAGLPLAGAGLPLAGAGLPPEDVAIGLRALLASGSTTRLGPHANAVLAAMGWLERKLPVMSGAELAGALAAYMEGAMITGGDRLVFGVRHADRLAREIVLDPSSLWAWSVSAPVLADAGTCMTWGAGLGMDVRLAEQARRLLAEHLGTRVRHGGDVAISARIALLFAFRDLVDLPKLMGDLTYQRQNPHWLAGDLRGLHLLSWSILPSATDWARFNQRLRSLAMGFRPGSMRDAAALCLALSVYYAAPGGGPESSS